MTILKTLILAAAFSFSLAAGPVLTLTPSGDLSGRPGETVGWNFTLTSDDTEWISVIGSFPIFETNPLLGIYTDIIGSLGGPTNNSLAPGEPAWQGLLANYQIDPLAAVNDSNFGTIFVLYERFSADPSTCNDCRTGEGQLEAAFSVTVSDVPEPGTWALLAAGLALCGIARRSRRSPVS